MTKTSCGRCGRVYAPESPGADQWNAVLSRGVVTGVICPDCQDPSESTEAAVNEATLDYRVDGLGRVRGRVKGS
jgi:hypothetical protein